MMSLTVASVVLMVVAMVFTSFAEDQKVETIEVATSKQDKAMAEIDRIMAALESKATVK